MNAIIEQTLPPQPSASGKMQPPKVKLADGRYCTLAKGLSLDQFRVGASGTVEVTTKQNGQYTNHIIESWKEDLPPATPPPTPLGQREPVKLPVDQSVWDAKERIIAMEAATKSHDATLAAMIQAGWLKTPEEVQKVHESITLRNYEMFLLARQNRIANTVDPFAEE